MSCRTNCCKKFTLIFALLAVVIPAMPAFAQNTCIQNEYNLQQGVSATGTSGSTKLNCTANDVRIAKVTNIRDPLTGTTLTSCLAGQLFNFLADFEILTTSSQARENIGLYIATASTTQALTGSCVDNIISPAHACPSNSAITCGSDNYHETDAAPDNCGDTSSGDNSATFGAGAEKVTLEIDNFVCEAPAGSNNVVLPNCTSWQIPGGTIQCVSPSPTYPYPFNGPGGTPTAVPGTKSKCNCGIITLPITVQTPSINVGKTCNTVDNTQAPDFTTNPPTPNNCTTHPEGGQVTYTVNLNNDKSNFGSVVIDQICDSAYGTVFTDGTLPACAAGSTGQTITGTTCNTLTPIAFNTAETCTFTVNQPESTTVADTVNASGHGSSAGTFGPTSSNSVTVTSNEAPSSATVTKGFVGTEAACATVRYSVDVHNSSASGTDETESLTVLTDNAYGSITSVHDSVLGTTCGVASGVGTLSGTAGGGAFSAASPATIAVGGDYTCQFDGQFCSAIDLNSCISHTNSVSGTITGDEAGDVVSQSANTLTVKECLTATVTTSP